MALSLRMIMSCQSLMMTTPMTYNEAMSSVGLREMAKVP